MDNNLQYHWQLNKFYGKFNPLELSTLNKTTLTKFLNDQNKEQIRKGTAPIFTVQNTGIVVVNKPIDLVPKEKSKLKQEDVKIKIPVVDPPVVVKMELPTDTAESLESLRSRIEGGGVPAHFIFASQYVRGVDITNLQIVQTMTNIFPNAIDQAVALFGIAAEMNKNNDFGNESSSLGTAIILFYNGVKIPAQGASFNPDYFSNMCIPTGPSYGANFDVGYRDHIRIPYTLVILTGLYNLSDQLLNIIGNMTYAQMWMFLALIKDFAPAADDGTPWKFSLQRKLPIFSINISTLGESDLYRVIPAVIDYLRTADAQDVDQYAFTMVQNENVGAQCAKFLYQKEFYDNSKFLQWLRKMSDIAKNSMQDHTFQIVVPDV